MNSVMNTKRLLKVIICGVAVMSFAACSDPVKDRVGDYSYTIAKQTVTVADTINTTLTSEKGALEIEKKGDDGVVLTFNSLTGDVYTTTGTIKNDALSFKPFKRTVSVLYKVEDQVLLVTEEKTVTEDFDVTVSGTAEMHDETIHFYLNYKGKGVTNRNALEGENILMVAKKN